MYTLWPVGFAIIGARLTTTELDPTGAESVRARGATYGCGLTGLPSLKGPAEPVDDLLMIETRAGEPGLHMTLPMPPSPMPLRPRLPGWLMRWTRLSASSGLRSLVNLAAGVGLAAVVAGRLAPRDLSIWLLSVTTSALIANQLDAGVQHAAVRQGAVGFDTLDDQRAAVAALTRNCVRRGLVGVVVAGGIGAGLGLLRFSDTVGMVIAAFMLATVGSVARLLTSALAGYLFGADRPWAAAVLSIGGTVAWALVAALAVFQAVPLLAIVAIAQAPLILAAMVARATLMRRALPPSGGVAAVAGFSDTRTFVALNIAGLVTSGLDVYTVTLIARPSLAAYVFALQAVAAFGLLSAAVTAPIVRHAAQLAGVDPKPMAVRRAVQLVSAASLAFVAFGIPAFEFIAPVWLGPIGDESARLFRPLACAVALHAVINVCGLFTIGQGRPRVFLPAIVAESVVNLTASILLGLRWGSMGVAVASVLGAVVNVALVPLSMRRWGSDPDWIKLGKTLTIVSVLIVVTAAVVP